MFLLDTGVLFAALHQSHTHHELVNDWLSTVDGYATCGLTQIGVFRLLLTDAAMRGYPLEAAEAHKVLIEFASTARHTFLRCPSLSGEFVGQTRGHRAAFDDYLVQIAHDAHCKLATLDRSLVNRWSAHALLVG